MRKIDDNPEKNMNILDHLEELRVRILYSALFLIAGFGVAMFAAKPVVGLLLRPFSGVELRRDEKVLQIEVREDGTLHILNPVVEGMFEELSPYRIHFFEAGSAPDEATSATEALAAAATSSTLPTDSGLTSASSWGLKGVWSRLERFLLMKDPSKPGESPPDFVFGESITKPVFLNPIDPMVIWFKTGFILGVILSLPFIMYQVWLFVAPGMRQIEKKTVLPILLFGALLFPIGASFAYFAYGFILDFLLNFQLTNMEAMLNVRDVLGLLLKLMLSFGVAFELPIVIMFLTLIGLVSPAKLRAWRSYAIVIIAFMSMILTPTPDPLSMLAMMGPLIVLYEISILVSIPVERKKKAAEDAELAEYEADVAAEAAEAELEEITDGESTEEEVTGDSSAGSASSPTNYGHDYGGQNAYYDENYYNNAYYNSSPDYRAPTDFEALNKKRWKRKQLQRKRRSLQSKKRN